MNRQNIATLTRAVATRTVAANPVVWAAAVVVVLLVGVIALAVVASTFFSNQASAAAALCAPAAATNADPTLKAGTVSATIKTAYVPGRGESPNSTVVAIAREVVNATEASPKVADALYAAMWVESGARSLANVRVPISLTIPHDPYPGAPMGAGSDGYSVGPLQGQTIYAATWGTPQQIMDPAWAFSLFVEKASAIEREGFTGTAGELAQRVQGSANPDAYDAAMTVARHLQVDGTTGQGATLPASAAAADPSAACPATGPQNGTMPNAVPITNGGGACTMQDPTTSGCITPTMSEVMKQIQAVFGQWTDGIGCWRPSDPVPGSDHPTGKACDYTVGRIGTFPSGTTKARGDTLAAWVVSNAARLHVSYVIWQGRIWSQSRGWRAYGGAGVYNPNAPTGGHYDHVHVSVD